MTEALFPYQETGAAWLAKGSRVGLFDEPGLGKTAQAIAALDQIKAERVIVVCPAAVREVWKGEFKKFSTVPRRILKGSTVRDLYMFQRHKADVFIVSYEMAAKWAAKLEGDLYDVLILDESHYVKTHDALRTRALLGFRCDGSGGLARWAGRVWFLTGTPAPNDPVDMWPFLRFTGATDLGRLRFKDKFFTVIGVGIYSAKHTLKKQMIPELQGQIKAYSLRRTKADINLQLPPIWLTTQTVDGDTHEIKTLLRSYPGLEAAIVAAVEKGGLSFLDAAHIGTLRRLVGEAKAPAFVAMIREELAASDEKLVVMGLHKRCLAIVAEGLKQFGVVTLTGDTPEGQRVEAVRRFQEDPEIRVFVGQIRAAGTGLTLTAGANVVMVETDWAPAANAQALMRVHRIGQTKTVRARFITLANSIDEHVQGTVARKTREILQLGFADGLTDARRSA